VLVRVNGRAFAHALGPGLPGAAFVTTESEAEAKLAAPPPPEASSRWRIKRAFGMAGRGQRVVTPGKLADADRALVRGGMAEGGVVVEPDVAIAQELGLHGLLGPDGTLALGNLVVQTCDARGQWLRTRRAAEGDPAHAHVDVLRAAASRVARALAEAGYAGPFGIDAFVWRDRRGEARLQPLSEINARYAMGWPTGFGDR
jgi:phosphoribosylaminoimidazole carboxylase (NCAIR synthetase)